MNRLDNNLLFPATHKPPIKVGTILYYLCHNPLEDFERLRYPFQFCQARYFIKSTQMSKCGDISCIEAFGIVRKAFYCYCLKTNICVQKWYNQSICISRYLSQNWLRLRGRTVLLSRYIAADPFINRDNLRLGIDKWLHPLILLDVNIHLSKFKDSLAKPLEINNELIIIIQSFILALIPMLFFLVS